MARLGEITLVSRREVVLCELRQLHTYEGLLEEDAGILKEFQSEEFGRN